MKTASDHLFQLCKSMNKSERRYFHSYAHRNSTSSPNYFLMYKEVSALKHWQEEILDQALKNYTFYSQRAVVKHQLYHKLLDSLHLFHREQDEEEQLKRQLHQVYLLLIRNLLEQADKLLSRAIRSIEEMELYNHWPEAIRLQQMLIEKNLRTEDQQKNISIWRDLNVNINQLLTTEQTIKWQKIASYQQHFYGNATNSELTYSTQVNDNTSIMTQADEQQILALQAFQKQRPRLAYEHNLLQLQLLEKCLASQRGVPARYLSVFYNLLIDQLQLKEYDELYAGLQKLRKLPEQKVFRQVKKLNSKAFSWGFQLELNALLQQQDFAGGYLLLTDLEEGLKKHDLALAQSVRASLLHLGGLFAFHQSDYPLALTFLTPLYQQKPDLRQPIYRYAHLLYLLTHYELNHYEWLENAIINTRRQFRQISIEEKSADYWLVQFLKTLINQHPEKEDLTKHSVIYQQLDPANLDIEKFLFLSRWLTKF